MHARTFGIFLYAAWRMWRLMPPLTAMTVNMAMMDRRSVVLT